ncbi:MAG: nucleotidyltransferase family protein [Gemmatimonadota bacterium]
MIDGLVLAAGLGRRYGNTPKVLAPLHGRPLVRHAVDHMLEGGLRTVLVVTGRQSREVEAALSDTPAICVNNPAPELGISSSLRTGIQALPPGATAIVIAHADQPLISAATVRALAEAWRATDALAAVPRYRNADWGHPLLVSTALLADLSCLAGDHGARDLLQLARVRGQLLMVPIEHEAPLDVDTPADLARLLD